MVVVPLRYKNRSDILTAVSWSIAPSPCPAVWTGRWQGGRSISELDDNMVFDRRDTRRRPGDPLGFLPLGPRAHAAAQDDLVAQYLDLDPLGIRLSAAHERILDLLFDLRGLRLGMRVDRDEIGHAAHARQAPHDALGIFLLVFPFHLALERHPPLTDGHFHRFARDA